MSEKTYTIVKKVSSCTLGIYALHILVKKIIDNNFDMYGLFTYDGALLFYSIIIFSISLLLTMIIKKIPFIGKWIV